MLFVINTELFKKCMLIFVTAQLILLAITGIVNYYRSCEEDENNLTTANKTSQGKLKFFPKYKNKLFAKWNKKTKFILYWSPFSTIWDYQLGEGYKPFEPCEYSNCFATRDRLMIPLYKYDALIFHSSYNKIKHGVPWQRTPHQRYILMAWEPPTSQICPNLKEYDGFYNWTMSYRFDADVDRRFGYIIKEKTNYTLPSKETIENKPNLIAWMVNICRTPSRREYLVDEIKKYANVDVYGLCGKRKCSKKQENITSPKCYKMLNNYKFHLSFEASYCKDYYTSRLYNVLQKDVVPIVYGYGNYKTNIPPYSVINVEDFESVTKLVAYIKYLDKNVDEYLKYFEWKKNYTVTTSLQHSACHLCEKLHEPVIRSVYHNLQNWWWGENTLHCKTKNNLPTIVKNSVTEDKIDKLTIPY